VPQSLFGVLKGDQDLKGAAKDMFDVIPFAKSVGINQGLNYITAD